VLSRNKIKYLSSLKIKKYRNIHSRYMIEGEKIVKEILAEGKTRIEILVATNDWLEKNPRLPATRIGEIAVADDKDISRITSMETPSQVIAVLSIPLYKLNLQEIRTSFSIALDHIQDPGNLGTIIRTANWFGIQHIFCSEDCADCYNPKALQASMGSMLYVKVSYTSLEALFGELVADPRYSIYGTFLEGTSVYQADRLQNGLVVFGNESRGIDPALLPYIRKGISIPPGGPSHRHVESLNVAAAVAIICALIKHA
jgi:TrmH family RNA methyltransferase